MLWLPETDDLVREYLYFVRHADIAGFVSERYDRSRIVVRHNIASSDALNRAVAQLQAFVDTHVDPALEVHITGKSVLSNRAVEAMARGAWQVPARKTPAALVSTGRSLGWASVRKP